MSEVLFKSKMRKLSPTRQALADAIQNLAALNAQLSSLDAATNFNGKAVMRVRNAEDAVLAAQEQIQRALKADADYNAGGPAPTMLPRHARTALLHAQDDVTDAKAALERTEQSYLGIKQEVGFAEMTRDKCHEAVLQENYGQVQRLVIEVERLQAELAAKGQLLEELAGPTGIFRTTVDNHDVVRNWTVAPVSWQIAWRPLPLLALYRDAVERMKHDASVILPDVTQPITDEHLSPSPVNVEQEVALKPKFNPTRTPGFIPERLPNPEPMQAQRQVGYDHNDAIHHGMPMRGDMEGQTTPIRTGRIGSGAAQRQVNG
jgi:hypothetical protein